MEEAKTLQSILECGIDTNDKNLWDRLPEVIQRSTDSPLDRRGVMNLKLLIGDIVQNHIHLPIATSILKLLKSTLKTELIGELSDIVIQLIFKQSYSNEQEIIEFIKTLTLICSDNYALKYALFEDTTEEFLSLLDSCTLINHQILSAIFEFEIISISKCPANRKTLAQHANVSHLSKCFTLIQTCKDSLIQVLATEWMWRLNECLSLSSDEVSQILKDRFHEFSKINAENFRSSIHAFVRAVNQVSKSPLSVLHVPFGKIAVGNSDINCSGWLDINKDSLAAWLLEKDSLSLPDVVIFRIPFINIETITINEVSFSTKEKIVVFAKIGEPKPNTFSFNLKKCSQSTIKALNSRFSHSPKSVELRKRSSRVVAGRSDESEINLDQKIEEIKEDPKLPSTQEREDSLHQIERMIDEYHQKSIQDLESIGEKYTAEIKEITAKLSEQSRMLQQLSTQHKSVTDSTAAENSAISESVKKLFDDFQSHHEDTIKKRSKIRESVTESMITEKQQFASETSSAFASNAIIGFSNALANLQDLCSKLA